MNLEYIGHPTPYQVRGRTIFRVDNLAGSPGYLFPAEGNPSLSGSTDHLHYEIRELAVTDPAHRGTGPQERFLVLAVDSEDLAEPFRGLMAHCLMKLSPQNTAQEFLSLVLETYESWKAFFGGFGSPSMNTFTGLVGELHVLAVLAERLGVQTAEAAWWGPFRNRHDFELTDRIVEVKTTIAAAALSITIHGTGQLNDLQGRPISIAVVSIIPDEEGRTLAETIAALIDAGVPEAPLREKLDKVGYGSAAIAAYKELRTRVVAEWVYEVDAAFPKLTPATLSGVQGIERVSNLRYTLNLEGIPRVLGLANVGWLVDE